MGNLIDLSEAVENYREDRGNLHQNLEGFTRMWRFYLEGCLTCEELVGSITGDDGDSFSSAETGPETSSSKFRDCCSP